MPEKRKNTLVEPVAQTFPTFFCSIGFVLMLVFHPYYLNTVPAGTPETLAGYLHAISGILAIISGIPFIGWLIGWGLRILFMPAEYTEKGLSLNLAQFILSIISFLIFIVGSGGFILLFFPTVSILLTFGVSFVMSSILIAITFVAMWMALMSLCAYKVGRHIIAPWLGMTDEDYLRTMNPSWTRRNQKQKI